MELVIAIEDNIIIGLELGSDIGPEGLEVRCRSENGAVVSSKIVRIDNSMPPSCCDEIDDSSKGSEVGGIERGGHRSLS